MKKSVLLLIIGAITGILALRYWNKKKNSSGDPGILAGIDIPNSPNLSQTHGTVPPPMATTSNPVSLGNNEQLFGGHLHWYMGHSHIVTEGAILEPGDSIEALPSTTKPGYFLIYKILGKSGYVPKSLLVEEMYIK